jgi:hypothetical protein
MGRTVELYPVGAAVTNGTLVVVMSSSSQSSVLVGTAELVVLAKMGAAEEVELTKIGASVEVELT